MWEFEQVRSLVTTIWPWARVEMDRPVTIISVSDQESMAVFVPESEKTKNEVTLASYLAEGPDRSYILVRSDITPSNRDGINLYYWAYYSYLRLILDSSLSRPLPPWFDRGMRAPR